MTNPAGLSYVSTSIEQYARPTALLIPGRTNYVDPAFQAARAAGAEVLRYLCPTDIVPSVGPLDAEFLSLLSPWGNNRTNYTINGVAYPVADLRVGSATVGRIVNYIAAIAASGQFDGVFLDVVGARLWSADYVNNWTEAERLAWRDGNIDLCRRLHEAVPSDFLLVNNGRFGEDDKDIAARAGDLFLNGSCIEHHGLTTHKRMVCRRSFGRAPRRFVWIANSVADAQQIEAELGEYVTHVSAQFKAQPSDPSPYLKVAPPAVGFSDLRTAAFQLPSGALLSGTPVAVGELTEIRQRDRNEIAALGAYAGQLESRITTLEEDLAQVTQTRDALLRDADEVRTAIQRLARAGQ